MEAANEADPLAHYRALVAKVDGFVRATEARYRADMECRKGCFDCCLTHPTVTRVEAALIEQHVAAMSDDERRAVRDHLEAEPIDPARCAALDGDGSCVIYAARPLVCRSHGVPIRMDDPVAARRADGLSVIEVCPKNFRGEIGVADVEPGAVLDQTTVSTVLAGVDAAFCQGTGKTPGRLELAALLRELVL